MPIGFGQAFCASQQQRLDLSFRCHLFSRLDLVSCDFTASNFTFDPISSHVTSHLTSHLVSFHPIGIHVISSENQQADVKPSFHGNVWRLRRMSWDRVTHVAISFQFLAISISCEGVAFHGHQSTPLCPCQRKLEKLLNL